VSDLHGRGRKRNRPSSDHHAMCGGGGGGGGLPESKKDFAVDQKNRAGILYLSISHVREGGGEKGEKTEP